jgi:hypothetical protein
LRDELFVRFGMRDDKLAELAPIDRDGADPGRMQGWLRRRGAPCAAEVSGRRRGVNWRFSETAQETGKGVGRGRERSVEIEVLTKK